MKNAWTVCILFLSALTVSAAARAATAVAAVDVNTQVKPDLALSDDPQARLRIVAPRHGVGAGQLVVKAGAPLRELKATVSELAAPDGSRLPAAAVAVRFGTRLPDVGPDNFNQFPWETLKKPFFDGLTETLLPGEALQPVWFTVAVPPDAKPGAYSGRVNLALPGGARTVPLTVTVSPFLMPEPGAQRMWVSTTQSPDTVAARYKVAPWSDAHLKLLEPSLRLQAQLGDCVLYVPVLTHTALGHSTGMVYFRRDGQALTPDFTALDRYLELYTKHCGRPRLVILNVWEPYLSDAKAVQKLWVSVAKAGGGFEDAELPAYAADQKPLWKAVVDGALGRAAKAGLPAAALLLGTASDWRPTQEQYAFFAEVAPKVRWASFTHGYGGIPAYSQYLELPDGPACHGRGADVKKPDWFLRLGWNNPDGQLIWLNTQRDRHDDNSTPWTFRVLHDCSPDGKFRGLARLGLDFWAVPASDTEAEKAAKERKYRPKVQLVAGRYPSNYGRLYRHPIWAMSIAGPAGALSTARLEVMREGFQQAEARIACERAIVGGKLAGPELELCRAGARASYELDYVTTDAQKPNAHPPRLAPPATWQESLKTLYDAAGLAQQRLGGQP